MEDYFTPEWIADGKVPLFLDLIEEVRWLQAENLKLKRQFDGLADATLQPR